MLGVKDEKDKKGFHVVEVGCVNHDKPYKVTTIGSVSMLFMAHVII